MAHGYMREYDEDYDRGDNRDRNTTDRDRNWRGQDRDWQDRDRHGGDRNRDRFMLGEDRGGYYDRQQRRWENAWEDNGDYPRRHRPISEEDGFEGGSDWNRGHSAFTSAPEDHYRSWRQQHMDSLDRDYADYCREREEQFHRDFDSWRSNRRQSASGSKPEVAEEAELELTEERARAGEGNTPSPAGEATLGTNNSENSATARRR